MQKEIELTGYCGLYCGDCIRYKGRFADLAGDLRNELKQIEFEKYAKVKSKSVKELRNYKEFCEILEVLTGLQCNNACRYGGCPTFSCKIIECCRIKGYQGCWECSNFEKCEEFEFLKPFHGDLPLKNLKKIKKFGLDKWTDHRERYFVWST